MNIRIPAIFALVLGVSGCINAPTVKPAAVVPAAPPVTKGSAVSAIPKAPNPDGSDLAYFSVPDESLSEKDDVKADSGDKSAPANKTTPEQDKVDYSSPQAIADALSADAKVEVTEWAQETLSTRFCATGSEASVHFLNTCHTISNYMQEPYKSAGLADMQLLQDAVRTDLRNYALTRLIRQEGNDWRWPFLASLIERTHKSGARKALGWIKDVPYIRDTCKRNADDPICQLRAQSIVISAYLAAQAHSDAELPDRCGKMVEAITDEDQDLGSLIDKQLDCKTVKGLQAALEKSTTGSKAEGVYGLLADAIALDRLYGSAKASGINAAWGIDAYADRFVQLLFGMEGIKDLAGSPAANQDIKFMFRLYSAAATNNYREIVYQLTEQKCLTPSLGGATDADTDTYDLLMLAGDIANAGNIKDLSDVINSVAGPSGGYKYKTIAHSLLSLTGLVGLDFERDRLTGQGINTDVWARGAFAPVGLEWSTPCWNKADCGVLLSLIDVGSLINYSNTKKTNNGTVNSSPNTNFSQVQSLGLYAVFGFPDSPFVIGFGWSTTPALRTATFRKKSIDLNANRVILFFVAVDVTLAPLKENWSWH